MFLIDWFSTRDEQKLNFHIFYRFVQEKQKKAGKDVKVKLKEQRTIVENMIFAEKEIVRYAKKD